MRRLLLLLIVLCCSGDVFDAQVRLRFLSSVAPPSAPSNPSPANSATGVSITPTLTCTATDTITVYLGTDNPPTNITNGSGIGSCSYATPTLSYSTAYNWKICATNGGGSTCTQWSFTTQADPGPGDFVDHPRLLLTSAKLSELTARKDAVTAEYTAMKSYTDTYVENGCDFANCREQTTTLTSTITQAQGASTTFTVADGAWLPTGAFDLRVDIEVIGITSRSGNTLTIAARGKVYSDTTATVAHASGANVWYHDPSDFNGLTMSTALLNKMGVAGYDIVARHMLNELATYFGPPSHYMGDNAIRWYGFFFALGMDWNWDALTANEKTIYCTLASLAGDDHIDNPKEGVGVLDRTSQYQAVIGGNNIANGQIRSVLAMSAVCAGHGSYSEAQAHWDEELAKVTDYIIPAMNGGATHGGIVVEGTEYMQTDWVQLIDIIQIIESAVNNATIVDSVDEWYGRAVKAAIYLTVPGTTNATTTTTGSCSSGSTAVTVASSTSYAVGQDIYLNGGVHLTTLVAVSGTNWTIRDPCPALYTNVSVGHRQLVYAFGDVENASNWNDFGLTGSEPQTAVAHAQDRLATSDATLAGYAEYWLDNIAPTNHPGYISWKWFLAHEPAITAVDYTAGALANGFSTDDPDAMGFMIAKSNWSATASAMYLIAGHEVFDHGQAYFGDYGYRRKGVYLTRHISGYGAGTGLSGDIPFNNYPNAGKVNETPWLGAPYKNVPWMNGHGPVTPYTNLSEGAATLSRSGVTSDYVYGRVDASLSYQYNWVSHGHANNDAQTFVRDWLAIPGSDVMAFNDRLVYSNATTSPTKWRIQTPGNPSVTAQRLTMTHGLQTLIQDILLPTSATIGEVDHSSENAGIVGYRTEIESGVSASTEYGFHVLQGGDSGFSPLTVTTLTTTNANVAQVGTTFVVGFVKGATPTLDIVYTLSGTPRNLVCGLAVSTAYHVTRATNTITIAALTGSGDTTATAAGCLDFTL